MKTKTNIVLILCLGAIFISIGLSAQEKITITTVSGTINVQNEKKQQMTYGMDFERLWYWDSLEKTEKIKLMDVAFKKCRVDYARVAISGGAEIKEGDIKWEAYDKILDCMAHIKQARPDIKFFASPQPFHVSVKGSPYTCYPLWITPAVAAGKKGKKRAKGFFPDKAADYLVRYLKFITSKGYKITYIDTKNECCRNLRPAPIAKMVRRMKEQLKDDMPIVIAPSSYDYRCGAKWLQDAIDAKDTDFFQIAASHNTKMRGSMEEFAALAATIGKTSWNTELHFFKGPDELACAHTAVLWQHVRAGFSGINDWLSLGNEKKTHKMFRSVEGKLVIMRIYYIFKKLVNTSGGGNYLHSEIADI